MAIGERIRFFRKKKKLTQKELGVQAGYPEKSADIRVAQYENGSRSPRPDAIEILAETLGVSPKALAVPDIDNKEGLMHTLFALEDTLGLQVDSAGEEPFLKFGAELGEKTPELYALLIAWATRSGQLERGEITKEEYDRWRYTLASAEDGARS